MRLFSFRFDILGVNCNYRVDIFIVFLLQYIYRGSERFEKTHLVTLLPVHTVYNLDHIVPIYADTYNYIHIYVLVIII